FLRFRAPLDLFIAALDYNKSQHVQPDKLTGLYIAQSSLSGLPETLQQDLAPPPLINANGIYNSSIWLGLTPTYTPLHRDPNPNLFRQLHGSKIVRLLPPRAGETVFKKVQSSILGFASPRLRGEEMMHGPEKSALHDAIWTDCGDSRVGERTIYEARLDAGDAMYLPTGWWHSIKSAADDAESGHAGEGELNYSVNWWFR
ncbi:JmjC domain-containing protein, partial [Coniochaeta sp. PMI_546]